MSVFAETWYCRSPNSRKTHQGQLEVSYNRSGSEATVTRNSCYCQAYSASRMGSIEEQELFSKVSAVIIAGLSETNQRLGNTL